MAPATCPAPTRVPGCAGSDHQDAQAPLVSLPRTHNVIQKRWAPGDAEVAESHHQACAGRLSRDQELERAHQCTLDANVQKSAERADPVTDFA